MSPGAADGQRVTSIGRASTLLASGTIVSRILGFVSGVVLAQTLGVTGSAANTFALANQLPNNIYAIIAGGLLSAVFVPAIVRAGLHKDGGQGFINRLVTLGILLFLLAGIIATLAAPLLIQLYASVGSSDGAGFSEIDLALATAFAYWCLPQVLFYALYSLFGEVLNARGIFGPFTWAPVVNNLIAITGLIAFTVIFGSGAGHSPSGSWSSGMIALIAGSATLGVAIQAFFLCFFWRKAGLHYRPEFHWRGVGLGSAGKAAAWTFGMILVTQLAGIVQSNVAAIAASPGSDNASLAILRYAWLIFMLPHSIAAVSIATAYFTRMSTHKRDGKTEAFREDLSSSLLQIGIIIVFASVLLVVVAFPFSALFSHDSFRSVLQMAPVLIAFVIGLVPFSILFVLRRTFYALDDTRTPFFITLFQATLFIIGALLVAGLPTDRIAIGLAVVTTLAGIAQTGLAIVLIRRKLGLLGGGIIVARHALFFGASIFAAVFGLAIVWALGGFAEGGFAVTSAFGAILTVVAAGGAMAVVYLTVLTLARNSQAASIIQPVVRRFRGEN